MAVGFFRAPDPQWGLLLGGLTLGQWLCLGMIAVAGILELCYRPLRTRWNKL